MINSVLYMSRLWWPTGWSAPSWQRWLRINSVLYMTRLWWPPGWSGWWGATGLLPAGGDGLPGQAPRLCSQVAQCRYLPVVQGVEPCLWNQRWEFRSDPHKFYRVRKMTWGFRSGSLHTSSPSELLHKMKKENKFCIFDNITMPPSPIKYVVKFLKLWHGSGSG